LTTEELKRHYGEQSLGEVLNKVADPNHVDATKKMRAVGNDKLDKDAFFKLMLTQMRNQDPTNPLKSHEMAAQLAQFTSLEQLTNINTTLEGMSKSNQPNTNFQALAFVGKVASGDTSKVTRIKGDTEHEFNFRLLGEAAKVQVEVKDVDGKTVRTLQINNLKAGENQVRWNGLQDDGQPARAGEYRFVLEAKNSAGRKVAAKTDFSGPISGLSFTPEGPVLMVGRQQIRLSDVKKIEEAMPVAPGAMLTAQAAAAAPKAAPGMAAAPSLTAEVPGAEEAEVKNQEGAIESIPMARQLYEQVSTVKR
jgi:flagellar basal-body rod modification protein FlgD